MGISAGFNQAGLQWERLRANEAFEAIVDKSPFAAAQAIIRGRSHPDLRRRNVGWLEASLREARIEALQEGRRVNESGWGRGRKTSKAAARKGGKKSAAKRKK
jgi:hypothetical protein